MHDLWVHTTFALIGMCMLTSVLGITTLRQPKAQRVLLPAAAVLVVLLVIDMALGLLLLIWTWR